MTKQTKAVRNKATRDYEEMRRELHDFINHLCACGEDPSNWPLMPQEQTYFIRSTIGRARKIRNTQAFKLEAVTLAANALTDELIDQEERKTMATKPPKFPTVAEEQALVGKWNQAHKIGTPVIKFEYMLPRRGKQTETKTKSEAWLMGGHTAVVLLENFGGCVSLNAIWPNDGTAPPDL